MPVGGTASAEFRVRNTNASLSIGIAEIFIQPMEGGDSFSLARGTCGAALGPGETCVLSVRLAPTSSGRKRAAVTEPPTGGVRSVLWIDLTATVLANPTHLGDPCSAELPCGSGTCQGGFCSRPCAHSSECEPNSEGRKGACVRVAGSGRCVAPCDSAVRCYGLADARCSLTTSIEGSFADACSTEPLPPPPGGMGGAGGS